MGILSEEDNDAGSSEKKREYLAEDKISIKLVKFLTEDVSIKQAFKINLLEEKFLKWREVMKCLNQKGRIGLLDEKREKKKEWTPVLEESHSFIRWFKFTEEPYVTFIKNSALILSSGYFIFIYDVDLHKEVIYSASDVDGISCIKGSQEEDLFAFSEKKSEPSIFIVTYPNLHKAFVLRDQFAGKVIDIHFGSNGLLLSLKCDLAEHRVVIWYWRCTYILYSYILDRPIIHPVFFCGSFRSPSYAVIQEHLDKTLVQFWKLNIFCDESVLVRKETVDISLKKYIFHCVKFDSKDILHLLDEKGNLYIYDTENKKVKLIIPWNPQHPPIDDIVEKEILAENFLPKRRKMNISKDEKVEYVKEEYKELIKGESKTFVFKKFEYVDVDSLEYEDNEVKKKKKHKVHQRESEYFCHFEWYKDGIVVYGPKSKLKYYEKEKESGKWMKKWGMVTSFPIKSLITNQRKDRLFCWSEAVGLKEIMPMETSNKVLHYFGGSVRCISLLHPLDNFLLTLMTNNTLCIWRKKTGRLMNLVRLEADMKNMTVHHNCALVALFPFDVGAIYGVDLTYPRMPRVWPVLNVCREPFAWIRFFEGDWLLACSINCFKVMLIKGTIHDGFEVISAYDFFHPILNMIGVLAQDGIYYGVALFEKVPPGTQNVPKGYKAGKVFEVLKFPHLNHERAFTSENFYKNIYPGISLGHVLAMPGDAKWELHNYCMDVKAGGRWRMLGAIKVEHQVGTFDILIAGQHYITYGYDGHIIVHDSSDLLNKDSKPMAVLRNHHRWDEGVIQAVIDYKGKYVFSLGNDGLLICSRLKFKYSCHHPFHVPNKQDIEPRNPLCKDVLIHVRDYEECFWEDIVDRKKYETDKLLAECRLARIKKEFENIKKLWNEYYEQNRKESGENRLNEDAFEMDRERKPIMEDVLSKEIIKVEKELTAAVKSNKFWIKSWHEFCWGKMLIKLYRIKPFEARFFLENFNQCLKPYKYVCYHAILTTLSQMDGVIFPVPSLKMLPWNPLDKDNVFPESKLQKDPYQDEVFSSEKEQKLAENIGEEEQTEEDEEEEVEEEVEVEGEEEQEESEDDSADDLCKAVRKDNKPTKEELAQDKFFEEEINKDDKELMGPIEPLTVEEIIALDDELDKLIEQDKEGIKNYDNLVVSEEQLMSLTAWKEAAMKRMKEGVLTNEQKKTLLATVLDRLVELDKKRMKEVTALIEKGQFGPEKGDVIEERSEEDLGMERKEGEGNEEKEKHEEEEREVEEEEEEEEGEEETQKMEEGLTDLQELEGKLFLQSLEPKEDEVASSVFSWTEIALEEISVPDYEEELPAEEVPEEQYEPVPQATARPVHPVDQIKVELDELPEDPLDEPYFMIGSQSPKFVPFDFARLNEFTCNGIFVADARVTALKGVIDELEEFYNEKFDQKLLKKAEDLEMIKTKLNQITENMDNLTNVCKGEPPDLPPNKYKWTLGEIPEWNFEYNPSEEEFCKRLYAEFAKYKVVEKLTVREELKKELKEMGTYKREKEEVEHLNEDDKDAGDKKEMDEEEKFHKDALYEMMDGVIEMSWQEIIMKGVKIPSFVNEKDPDSYTENEKIALGNYFAAMKKLDEMRGYHSTIAQQNIEVLQGEIKEIAENYDLEILETLKERILIESCIQSELLKIYRMKMRRFKADKGFEHIKFLKSMKSEFLDRGVELSLLLKYLQRKLAFMIKEGEKYELIPEKIEKDFLKKIHPLGISKKYTDQLKTLLRTRPMIPEEFEMKAYSNELHAVAAYLHQDYKPIYLSNASTKFFSVLEELDNPKNCPSVIEPSVWEWLVHSRHGMLSAHFKLKIYKSFIPEMEAINQSYLRYFLNHLERVGKIQDAILLEKEVLANYCKKMEFQLILPDCSVETLQTGDIEDFSDCVYVSKKYIDKLNEDIVELEKSNEEKLKEMEEKLKYVLDIELVHKELCLLIKIEENNLRDIKYVRFDKYTKDYIAQWKATNKEPYETKDYDLARADKLKKIVRVYFKKYYDLMKQIKRVEDDKRDIMKQNILLEKSIDKLNVENQKGRFYHYLIEDEKKPLKERNEAIRYKGTLSRKVAENDKEIDRLYDEFIELQNKIVPHLTTKAL